MQRQDEKCAREKEKRATVASEEENVAAATELATQHLVDTANELNDNVKRLFLFPLSLSFSLSLSISVKRATLLLLATLRCNNN